MLSFVYNIVFMFLKMGFEFKMTKSAWELNAPIIVKLFLTLFAFQIDLCIALIGIAIILMPLKIILKWFE